MKQRISMLVGLSTLFPRLAFAHHEGLNTHQFEFIVTLASAILIAALIAFASLGSFSGKLSPRRIRSVLRRSTRL
jgi:hypothetical protein